MFLVKETPGKVMTLLGTALFSMAFLFAVSSTNASFAGAPTQVANPFGPTQVMAVLDNTSNAYSNFLAANLFNPVKSDYALAASNLAWIGSNAQDGALAMLHVPQTNSQAVMLAQAAPQGAVLGAQTSAPQLNSQPSMLDEIYSALVR